MDILNYEQLLYAKIIIAESLIDDVRSDIQDTKIDNQQLIFYMDGVLEGLRAFHYEMRLVVTNLKENDSVYRQY